MLVLSSHLCYNMTVINICEVLLMEFSDKIKLVRGKLGMSQEALAKELGVSFATVNRWESGKFLPNYKAINSFENFCKANNIDLSITVTGD